MINRNNLTLKYLLPFFIVLLSSFILFQYGFQGKVTNLSGNYLYSGMRMAEGIPPYVNLFNQTGPTTPLLTGLIIKLAKFLNLNEIYLVRLGFLLCSLLSILFVYLLSSHLFKSYWAGIINCLLFLNFEGFVFYSTAIGPEKKILMLCCALGALYFITQKKWFFAGLLSSLSALTWQPTGIIVLTTLLLSLTYGPKSKKYFFYTIGGLLLPLIIISGYFFITGSFKEMFEGVVLFNLKYNSRALHDWTYHFTRPTQIIARYFPFMKWTIPIGLIMMLAVFHQRNKDNPSLVFTFTKDPFACFFITCPAFLLFTFIDFQFTPDVFILLIFIVCGLFKTIDVILYYIKKHFHIPTWPFYIAISIFLFMHTYNHGKVMNNIFSSNGLNRQQEEVNEFINRFGSDFRLLTIGKSQLLVLLNKINPTRYTFISTGIDQYIELKEPEGFDGWIKSLKEFDPLVVVVSKSTRGQYVHKIFNWIEKNYSLDMIGPWEIYVKNKKHNPYK